LLFVSIEAIHQMSMSLSRGRWMKLAALLVAFTGLGACIAPILTVPPPGAADLAFASTVVTDADGGQKTVWIAQGGPLPQAALATYYLRNRTLAEGVFATARADGSFISPQMDGKPNDPIQIYYVTPAGDYSVSICVLLTEGSSPPLCPP
jgi:hypothetical protein